MNSSCDGHREKIILWKNQKKKTKLFSSIFTLGQGVLKSPARVLSPEACTLLGSLWTLVHSYCFLISEDEKMCSSKPATRGTSLVINCLCACAVCEKIYSSLVYFVYLNGPMSNQFGSSLDCLWLKIAII